MHAVAPSCARQIGPVVEDEGDIRALRDRHQDFGGALDLVVARIFQAQLQRRDIAGAERALQFSANARGSSFGGVMR